MLALRKINLDYLGYVVIMTVVGALPGMYFQTYIVNLTGRRSTTVYLLATCLVLAAVSMLGVTIPVMTHKSDDFLGMGQYC